MAGATPDTWRGTLAVTGMGLVTPVGLRADASCAALRAGVSRLESLPDLKIRVDEEELDYVIGATVSPLVKGLLGPERLLKMMRPAFAEALEDAGLDQQRLGVFLGTSGSSPAGRVLNYDDAVRDNLLASVPKGFTVERAKLVQAGRASVQKSLRSAALALEQNMVDAVVVGAVDSWVTPRALQWLRREGRLPEYPRHTGNPPAEAAGFLVLELPEAAKARGARTYAHIVASAGRLESARWGEASNATALTQAIQAVVGDVEDAHAVVVSDLDGERYRAMEWVMAEPKAMWYHRSLDHWNPADCIGDSGAAMGAVMLAWASMALHRDYAGSPNILCWGASDEGPREACMLTRVGGSA